MKKCNFAQEEAHAHASDPNALHSVIELAGALGPDIKHGLNIRERLRRSAVRGGCCPWMQMSVAEGMVGAIKGREERGEELEG